MGDEAKINGLVELYKSIFEDPHRLNDLDWRYITTLSVFVTAFVGMLSWFNNDIPDYMPPYFYVLILLWSIAALVSVITSSRTMNIRLYTLSNIESELNNLYKSGIFPPIYEGPPKNIWHFMRFIIGSIRGPLVLIYSFVIFVCLFLIFKLIAPTGIILVIPLPIVSIISTFLVILFIFCNQDMKFKMIREAYKKKKDAEKNKNDKAK